MHILLHSLLAFGFRGNDKGAVRFVHQLKLSIVENLTLQELKRGLDSRYISSELLRKVYIDFDKYRKWLYDRGLRSGRYVTTVVVSISL
jgi:hypothetical protein